MREKVEKALERIRPALNADGGDVELVDIQDGIVKVRLMGACGGCPMSQMTLKMGIERVLREAIPEIKGWKRFCNLPYVILRKYFYTFLCNFHLLYFLAMGNTPHFSYFYASMARGCESLIVENDNALAYVCFLSVI